MRRSAWAISLGAVLSVLLGTLTEVPARASTFAVLNQCSGGAECREDRFLNVSASKTAPYEVTFKLGRSGCINRIGDRQYACKSARTASENTGTSIKWRYRQETSPGVFTAWNESATHTCGNNLDVSDTYCVDGEHLDTFVVATPGSALALQVHFKIVSDSNETIWLANNPDGWRIEYIHAVPNPLEPTAVISTDQFVIKNESFVISGENSNPNDETGTIASSTFAWDLNYIPNFTGFISGPSSRVHTFNATGTYTIRLRITNRFGNADIETKTIHVSEAPPSTTPSLALTNNRTYTNQATEAFDLVWPRYANNMNLDDGTTSASNRVLETSPTWTFNWGQVDSETRTLTATFFDGSGAQVATTLSHTVTYDSVSPVIGSLGATRTDGALSFSMSATDLHSGVSLVEISDGTRTDTHEYASSINSTLSGSNFSVRVKDLAGNWSETRNIAAASVTTRNPSQNTNQPAASTPATEGAAAPSPATTPSQNTTRPAASTPVTAGAAAPSAVASRTPRVATRSKTTAESIARQAGISVRKGSKIALSVSKSSKKICKVLGERLVALTPGNCRVTVSVTPPKTKAIKKPKSAITPTTVIVR